MNTSRSGRLFAAVALVGSALFTQQPVMAAPSANVPDQYIVVLKDTVADVEGKARGLAAQNGIALQHVYGHTLKGFSAVIPPARLAKLQADASVAYIQQDQVVSINNQNQPTGINRIDAELSPTAKINGVDERVNVDVAVLDTGIDRSHPDLNVVGGKNCQKGKNFADGNGHGTHVAGTIGALDNGVGVVGVAPGARLWAVRVLDNAGSGTWSDVICGVDWVTANADKIDVVNMSLSGGGSEPAGTGCTTGAALHDAICRSVAAGVTYVVAAGNSADNAAKHVPAAYDEVITVSALADFDGKAGGGAPATCRSDVDDTFASFSNYGADVDIIAPGVCINSTWKSGGYNTISGTSMAAPHVAGAAALFKANNPGATPSQVRAALINAGNLNWNAGDDFDTTKEPLLNAAGF